MIGTWHSFVLFLIYSTKAIEKATILRQEDARFFQIFLFELFDRVKLVLGYFLHSASLLDEAEGHEALDWGVGRGSIIK